MANQSSESRPGKTPAAKRPEDSRHPFPACESALDGLFRQALDRVAAQTNTEPLPTGLEERLMERAAGQGLFREPAAKSPGLSAAPLADAFDARRRAWRMPRWAWAPLAATAAALVLLVTLAPLREPPAISAPPALRASIPAWEAPPARSREAVVARGDAPRALHRNGERPAATPVAPGPDDGLPRYSEFLPTPYAFSFPSEEALQTVRVRIDAEDFLRLELPLAASHRATALLQTGRVTADFLVGDDGRPRAVRLVNLSD